MDVKVKSFVRIAIVLAILVAGAILAYEVFHWLTHVYAANARVQTELTKMSSRVDGTIDKILIEEGTAVSRGAPLIQLVADDVKLRIETLETDLILERAERARLASEKAAFEHELESALNTKEEEVKAIVSEFNYIRDRLRLAEEDLGRVRKLFERRLTSEKNLTAEKSKTIELRGQTSIARAKIAIAKRELEQAEARRKQLDVIAEKIRISDITSTRIKKQIALEQVSLNHRTIRSPVDGIIDRVYKHPGEYVEEGESILILHDTETFWLEAHVDEDSIRHVQVGQAAILDFEAYPFDEFVGRVKRIGSVTTRAMGIADVTSSRFGRSGERVPIMIAIEQRPPTLTPGMIANVNIRIDSMRFW
ncbi:MAG: efflux RND transporter periplasmic adaptor subunit [Pseudomonadota bacterium]